MIIVPINRDVTSAEAKLFGPFTFRQTISITAASVLCWTIYQHLGPLVSTDLAGFLAIIPATAVVFLGFVKPYGQPAERFIASVFVSNVLAPTHRKYRCPMELPAASSNKKKKRYVVSKLAVK